MQNMTSQPSPPVPQSPVIPEREIKRIAAEELVSVESVQRELLGLPVRGLAGERARRAARRLRAGT
jgi:hypothetical protein